MNILPGVFRDLPIRHKLAVVSLVTTGLALLVVGVITVTSGFVSARNALQNDMDVQAAVIAENSGAAILFRDRRSAVEILKALKSAPAIVYAGIYDESGQLFAAYRRAGTTETVPPVEPPRQRAAFGWNYLESARAIDAEGIAVGKVYVRAGLEEVYARLAWHAAVSGIAALVALLSAYFLIARLQHTVSGPISDLARLMRAVSEKGDYSQRAAIDARDEVGDLAAGFNAMLAHIEQRDEALRHELKERRRVEQRLDYLAHYDTVTHLPNRYFFNERLRLAITQAVGSGREAALLFVDLDNFKIINDTLGHPVGDLLLKAAADRMSEQLRSSDMLFRLGGDEFTLLLEGVGAREDVTHVAEKLLGAMARPFEIEGREVFIGASIGISLCPRDGTDGDTLLGNADSAMYYAKNRGKGTYQYFESDMKGKAMKRLVLETHLRRALERNEFQLHYQPIYDLDGNRVSSVEALLRWQHPDLGAVSPADFIPVTEETGLILPLGDWVLRTACAQAMEWARAGSPVGVAVNISGRQFRDNTLTERVLMVLAETGLPAERLTLELTESTLMDNSDETLERLRRLRAAGVRLSIDDFGTGYSSLSYLKRFPIETLKIDRSFVEGLPDDPDDLAITASTVAMANSLGLRVVAEGVERQEQIDYLRGFRSLRAQGYLLSRPLPPEEVGGLLAAERERTAAC